MIEQFFRPDSIDQALELKRHYPQQAVWFAGGSKLNATPNKTDARIAISLEKLSLDWADWDNGTLRIGMMTRLQTLRETHFIPDALYDALGFIDSRHLRNQATLGGEIACHQQESVLLPVLLALDALLVFADGDTLPLENWLADRDDRLLTELVIHEPYRACATRNIRRSSAGLSVLTAAVAFTEAGDVRIALDGVGDGPVRLRDAESPSLQGEALEEAVRQAIFPQDDLRGSAAYKRYIAGVVVADLYADCQQMGGECL